MTIQGIELLKKTAISKNNSARSIHNTANEALKWGTKTSYASAKTMNKLNDNLTKTDVTKKMCKATFERDTTVFKKKIAMSNLATKASALKKVKKELLDNKKELANAKKDFES